MKLNDIVVNIAKNSFQIGDIREYVDDTLGVVKYKILDILTYEDKTAIHVEYGKSLQKITWTFKETFAKDRLVGEIAT